MSVPESCFTYLSIFQYLFMYNHSDLQANKNDHITLLADYITFSGSYLQFSSRAGQFLLNSDRLFQVAVQSTKNLHGRV